MFDSISNFIALYKELLSAILLTALVIAALSQQKIRFWVRDFFVTLPFVGDIARLAKDSTRGNNGWLRAEQKLCAIYKPYVVLMNERTFNQRIEYLRKAADLGRAPTPLWVWFLLIVLVIAEGLGFSYLLGSWMAREGSASTHTLLMFAIVLVLCVIMVALTHFAGHQYYRTSLLRSCFQRYKDVGGQEYAARAISLSRDQAEDDREPEFKQIVNRVAKHSHDKGSYAAGIVAIVAIAVVAFASTYMRVKNLEGELIRETTSRTERAASNPFDKLALPTEVNEAQQHADNKAAEEAKSATHDEGLAAFAMLGFIFVITQIVGMGAGYKYGFGGKESLDAYKALGGFSTYDEYWTHFQPRRDLANARLKDLQQRIEEHSHTKLALTKTFDDFLQESAVGSAVLRDAMNATGHTVASVQTVAMETTSSVAAVVPAVLSPASLDAVMSEIKRLNEPGAEKVYFLGLPIEIRTNPELVAWLKVRKAQREAEANAEDLF